jgi:Domain of unknown function (DUF4160)
MNSPTPSRWALEESDVPRLSYFYGIVIKIYSRSAPSSFMAIYGEDAALIQIDDLEILAGGLPPIATELVRKWAALHRKELGDNWQLAQDGKPLQPIAGLD